MFVRVSLLHIYYSQKLLVLTVIFAALTQDRFSTLSSVFLMKPGVHCQTKRQNKLEKKTPLRILPVEQQNRKKFSPAIAEPTIPNKQENIPYNALYDANVNFNLFNEA